MARSKAPDGIRSRALSVVLIALYAASHLGAAISGWVEFVSEQTGHGQPAQVFGPDGYVWTLLEQTMQNWQSEFLALAVLIVLTSHLVHRGSKHSRDGSDEAMSRIRAIQRRVGALQTAAHG